MKKLLLGVAVIIGVFYGAARFVPGFWEKLPPVVASKVPDAWRAHLNVPAPAGAEKAAGARPAGGPPGGGNRAQQGGGRPVPVTVGTAMRKSMPVRVETIGTVQTIATVTVRPRVDSQIDQIFFADGAKVKAGDVLAKLDDRVIIAQIKQAEATLARDKANLELARRTLQRGEELAGSNFATKQRIDENRSAVQVQEASVKANEASLDNLRTQLTYYTIRAPIDGKAGLANLKPGNIAQSAAAATSITTINQISPIYVAFNLPQRYFEELRDSIAKGENVVEATLQGSNTSVSGKLTLIENTMDNATGTIGVRATFANADEILWPGAIANVRTTLRNEANVVAVPREAVQMSQRGSFVFVVNDGVAKMVPVKVGRGVDKDVIITEGLKGGETIITDGHLLVVDGAKVQARQPQANAGQPAGNRPAGL